MYKYFTKSLLKWKYPFYVNSQFFVITKLKYLYIFNYKNMSNELIGNVTIHKIFNTKLNCISDMLVINNCLFNCLEEDKPQNFGFYFNFKNGHIKINNNSMVILQDGSISLPVCSFESEYFSKVVIRNTIKSECSSQYVNFGDRGDIRYLISSLDTLTELMLDHHVKVTSDEISYTCGVGSASWTSTIRISNILKEIISKINSVDR